MSASAIALFSIGLFFIAYRFYSRYLANSLFNLPNEIDQEAPSHKYNDGIDYSPTKKEILFGHHFSSIAGAAPIVGPAVAAIWGWVPALIWVVFGVIFMGACHDFGALVISMKHKGESIANVAERLLGKRVRNLFLIVIFFLVWMVIAVFALVIANLFITFPSSVIPVNFEIIIAVLMGVFINKKGKSLKLPSIIAQATLFIMIYIGTIYPISLEPIFGQNQLMAWIIFLLIYSFIASILPVWTLLQPRDYINGHQLFLGLTLMIVGLIVINPVIVAPAINPDPVGAPPIFPFLFITIACGAVSGFHGLVSGGTTSKQVSKWKDARIIGYGSMLGEGLLALLATLAVTTGFANSDAWHSHYSNWNAANGLSAKINAFVLGAGNFVSGVGVPQEVSRTVIAVLIISFAATSLDTACRIQRYIIQELGGAMKIPILKNRFVGSGIAVTSAFLLMLTNSNGKGGLHLWPLFGATNQMLAALTLIVITFYLYKNKKNTLPFIIPAIFLLIITTIGLFLNIKSFISAGNIMLTSIGIILMLIQLWIIAETIIIRKRLKLVL